MLKSFSTLSIAARGASLATHSKPIIAVPKLGPYSLFVKENAAKHNGKLNKDSISVFSKEIAIKWKGLTDHEKQTWKMRAQEINDKAIDDFRKKPQSEQDKLEAAARDAKEKLAKKRERRERRENWEKTGHPKMPPNSYALFMKEKLGQAPKMANREENAARFKALAEEWRGLSVSAKTKYAKEAEAAAAKYKIEVEKWKKSNHSSESPSSSPTKAAAP